MTEDFKQNRGHHCDDLGGQHIVKNAVLLRRLHTALQDVEGVRIQKTNDDAIQSNVVDLNPSLPIPQAFGFRRDWFGQSNPHNTRGHVLVRQKLKLPQQRRLLVSQNLERPLAACLGCKQFTVSVPNRSKFVGMILNLDRHGAFKLVNQSIGTRN